MQGIQHDRGHNSDMMYVCVRIFGPITMLVLASLVIAIYRCYSIIYMRSSSHRI